ncbi:MAG: glycosyltransferase [Candidatus Hydrogenedentes bacterium]|nr:glycosyltransferase [Candidatus Hydrogenedentota bacterium]
MQRAAGETRRFLDLLYYCAVLRDVPRLAHWATLADHPEDRLVAALLLPDQHSITDAEHLALADEAEDPWVFHTLVKHFLARSDPKLALATAARQLKKHRQDTCCLNLIARWALHVGHWDLASQVSLRALAIAPDQKDLVHIALAAQDRRLLPGQPRTDLWPMQATVAYYLPCYNVERYIERTLQSILGQCHPLHELLIVDDASPDRTVEIAGKYPVRILRHEVNRGLAAARNTGVFGSTAEYVASVDTDACPDSGYIKYALMAFEQAGPALAGVGGRLIEMFSDSVPDQWRTIHMSQDPGLVRWYLDALPRGREYTEAEVQFYLTDIHFLTGSNNVFRRDAVAAVDGYDERHRTNAEDVYLCRKLKHAGYHLAFEPQLRASHYRRDSLRSLLKTAWNYAYWARTDMGFYRDAAKLMDLFKDHVIFGHWHLMNDMEKQRLELLYVDILFIFHSQLMDLHHVVNEGVLSLAQARRVQGLSFACVRELDVRMGGHLLDRMQNDVSDLLFADGAEAILPADAEPILQANCEELRMLFSDYSPTIYNALINKGCPRQGPGAA